MKEYPNGVCTIDLIDNAFQYLVPRAEFERLHAEWKAGAAFLSWVGHYCQHATVKGARIERIGDWSAEAWADVQSEGQAHNLTGAAQWPEAD